MYRVSKGTKGDIATYIAGLGGDSRGAHEPGWGSAASRAWDPPRLAAGDKHPAAAGSYNRGLLKSDYKALRPTRRKKRTLHLTHVRRIHVGRHVGSGMVRHLHIRWHVGSRRTWGRHAWHHVLLTIVSKHQSGTTVVTYLRVSILRIRVDIATRSCLSSRIFLVRRRRNWRRGHGS